MLGAWGLVVTPHQFFKSMVTMKRISIRFTSFSKTSSLKNARYSGKVENLRISHTNSIILPLPHISTPLDSFLGLGPMFPGFPGSASHMSKVPGRSIPCARDNHQHSSGSRAGSRPDMVLRRATPCKGAGKSQEDYMGGWENPHVLIVKPHVKKHKWFIFHCHFLLLDFNYGAPVCDKEHPKLVGRNWKGGLQKNAFAAFLQMK